MHLISYLLSNYYIWTYIYVFTTNNSHSIVKLPYFFVLVRMLRATWKWKSGTQDSYGKGVIRSMLWSDKFIMFVFLNYWTSGQHRFVTFEHKMKSVKIIAKDCTSHLLLPCHSLSPLLKWIRLGVVGSCKSTFVYLWILALVLNVISYLGYEFSEFSVVSFLTEVF